MPRPKIQNSGVDRITDVAPTVRGMSIPVNGTFAQLRLAQTLSALTGLPGALLFYLGGRRVAAELVELAAAPTSGQRQARE